MKKDCAFIVIDSGFSLEILNKARLIAAWDLTADRKFEGGADLLSAGQIKEFAGDPMFHGSIVVERLLNLVPDAGLILVKAFDNNKICRTKWSNGKIVHPGWTEAYVWAVELAKTRAMVSVCNCSFGGYSHAMDGSGWESHQVRSCTGPGKPGHVLVAAAGYGDARPIHGSLKLLAGEQKSFVADQDADSDYNFWFGLGQKHALKPWVLSAHRNGHLLYQASSDQIRPNLWNQRQQLRFRVWGSGRVNIDLRLADTELAAAEKNGDEGLKIDVWAEGARLRNWVSAELVTEPACFPEVIAVGLKASSYSPSQQIIGMKPDVLLPGSDQVSFRLPEVSVAVSRFLQENPALDVAAVKEKLGKYPS